MAITDIPRTLVYKDVEDINYFLGNDSTITLEREFYDRTYKLPFIRLSDNPLLCILSMFNNARYIYYLIECEEGNPSLCLSFYLEKAADKIEITEKKDHIAAATMSLVYSWLDHNDDQASKNTDITDLKLNIYLHFSKKEGAVTEEIICVFHSLLMKNSNLPTTKDTLFDNLRDIDECAMNAPIQDVAKGIDYLMECYDPKNGTNVEHCSFLNKILKRLENEKSPTNDSRTIEKAVIRIKQRLQFLDSSPEPESSNGYSLDNLDIIALEEDLKIPPEIIKHIEWISNFKKAPIILKTIRDYMEGKTKPKDLLMPLCAALEVGLIRKPTWKEYEIVFKDHSISSDTSLSYWVSSTGMNYYKDKNSSTIYNEMLGEFTKFKDLTF